MNEREICKKLAELFPEADMETMDAADFKDRAGQTFKLAKAAEELPKEQTEKDWLKHKDRTMSVGELVTVLSALDQNLPVSAMSWVMSVEVGRDPLESRRSIEEGFVKDLEWAHLKRLI